MDCRHGRPLYEYCELCLGPAPEAPDPDATISAIKAQRDELLDALRWYQDQMCEGDCRDYPSAGFYDPAMDLDCAGCKARAAIAKAEGK